MGWDGLGWAGVAAHGHLLAEEVKAAPGVSDVATVPGTGCGVVPSGQGSVGSRCEVREGHGCLPSGTQGWRFGLSREIAAAACGATAG